MKTASRWWESTFPARFCRGFACPGRACYAPTLMRWMLEIVISRPRDFTSANLHSGNFRESDLSGADFQDADLGDADFCSANLGGAVPAVMFAIACGFVVASRDRYLRRGSAALLTGDGRYAKPCPI
jgi:pentapeptide repeat protein